MVRATAIVIALVALALLVWFARSYLLLVFLGALLAILLRAPSDALARRTGMGEGYALALVCLTFVAMLGIAGYFFGSTLAAQTVELGTRLPQVLQTILERLREREWGQWLISYASGGEQQVEASKVLGGALLFAGTALEAIANVFIVLVFAVFLAAQPGLYVDGAVRLVPVRGRKRAREVLREIGEMLQRWLVGQSILMVCVSVLTGIALLLIGAPLALPLALLAGLLNFIPYVGPIVAAAPAVLVGFSEGPQMALYVAAAFVVVQSVEGYVLEPLVQRRAVDLAPALILFSQLILGLVGGPLGVIVATPLAATLLVAVRMLYVEDALEHP